MIGCPGSSRGHLDQASVDVASGAGVSRARSGAVVMPAGRPAPAVSTASAPAHDSHVTRRERDEAFVLVGLGRVLPQSIRLAVAVVIARAGDEQIVRPREVAGVAHLLRRVVAVVGLEAE